MPAIRDPYKMFAACLSFYRSNPSGDADVRASAMFSRIREALGYYLSGLSIMHEGAYPGWKADEEHPGYMIRIDPPVIMRAPYHLICAFPSETSLDAIWHLSRKVKTISSSVLCLSGSAAIIASSIYIGDIDFCEYVTGEPDDIADELICKMQSERELIFLRMRIGEGNTKQECDDKSVRTRLHAVKSSDPELSHAKIDFVGKPDGMRPTDVSNVIIFCDENWQSASLHRSFAAQEAHLDPVAAVPNMLCEPYEIGRYVDFLLSQAKSYSATRDFSKVLKRCLSLARLCFLNAISEEITRYILCAPEFLEREIVAIDGIISKIGLLAPDLTEWIEELEWVKQGLDHELGRVRGRPRIDNIEVFSNRMVTTLDLALAGKDLITA